MVKIKELLFFMIITINILCIYGLQKNEIKNTNTYNCNVASIDNSLKLENNKYDFRNNLNHKIDSYYKHKSNCINKAYSIMSHSYGAYKWFNDILKRKNKKIKFKYNSTKYNFINPPTFINTNIIKLNNLNKNNSNMPLNNNVSNRINVIKF
ncbi:hypothetical protein BCR32DRAFT_283050 [Anaeromyces robustus]|uniref:Uncharacterized protein n=1 Tax=Anaeromyces robustus TaxID=1754192 RepID=A0A1Y1WVP9_9FUNG|nr:hypothetical protein BCR32DRAFT_283050 [Anaeromyces robustus]|eukprot:ORX77593.1 hypothetical protein BCR32DRAFT_283050 [Anaeromyces robustus]